ncbi:MAG: peptidylprolyl isomerase, partial [Thiotrichales bacterium]|nr:peptidylprolyl isomerase [Thiotrichales bacterium]MBT7005772.1 peptidylprolyl isomerase [Thiotrichales bacterium]
MNVLMKTSMGDITLELKQEAAPKTVENFLTYCRDGFYDGTIFHRVIPNFMIQCGGMESG